MALASPKYRDPVDVLERKEEGRPIRSCAGCLFLFLTEDWQGRRVLKCRQDMEVGQRCKLYEERGR